jgi:hypothetical protein
MSGGLKIFIRKIKNIWLGGLRLLYLEKLKTQKYGRF